MLCALDFHSPLEHKYIYIFIETCELSVPPVTAMQLPVSSPHYKYKNPCDSSG